CGNHPDRHGVDLADRYQSLFPRALADHSAGRRFRRLAVLRTAPVRGYILEREPRLGSARSRLARLIALRSAAAAALVHRQYRYPPRASLAQPYSVLSAAARTARSP